MKRIVFAVAMALGVSGCTTLETSDAYLQDRAETSFLGDLPIPVKYTVSWDI